MSKRLGGIIGCKYKPLHGSPMVITLVQQYNTEDKPTVMLYTTVDSFGPSYRIPVRSFHQWVLQVLGSSVLLGKVRFLLLRIAKRSEAVVSSWGRRL